MMIEFIAALGAGIIASLGGETTCTEPISVFDKLSMEVSSAFVTNIDSVICENTNYGKEYSVTITEDKNGSIDHIKYTFCCFD